jgi:hypothetical protein
MKYAAAFIWVMFAVPSASMAQSMPGGVPVILQPKDGSTVRSPVTIVIGGGGADSTMSHMMGGQHGAHLHLIIDAPLPAAGKMVPMDAHHIHLMHGETQTTVPLKPGQHTVQLIAGSMSHVVAADAPHSDPVTFEVR